MINLEGAAVPGKRLSLVLTMSSRLKLQNYARLHFIHSCCRRAHHLETTIDVQHNRQVTLKSRPAPDAAAALDNFDLIAQELPATFAAGDVLVQLLYLSVDPYSRGMLNAGSEYPPSYQLGKVCLFA